MRMRRKKHLEERLNTAKDYLIEVNTEEKDCRKAVEEKEYIDVVGIFGNSAPIVLEIGCGKGQFTCEYAERHPDENVVAVERLDNVLVQACEKALRLGIKNVRFILSNAEYLQKFFKEKSIKKIILNFPPPYKKNTYKNRRLTYSRFLTVYESLLCAGGEVHMKTDDKNLFAFSIESFSQNGWKLKDVTLDLEALNDNENIMTEHEKKFVEMGKTINRLVAYKE